MPRTYRVYVHRQAHGPRLWADWNMDVAVVLAEADSLADLRAKVLRSLRQQVRKGFIDRIPEKIVYIRASRADRKHLQDYLRSLRERLKEDSLEWRNWRKAKLGLPSRD